MSRFSRRPNIRLSNADEDLRVAFTRKNWDARVDDAEEVARGPGLQALRDRIVALAGPAPGEMVVDLGAGTGLLALAVAGGVRKVWAVDSSRAMTEYLQVKAESAELDNVRVVHASVTNIPLVDCVADLILSNYCFHELGERDKHRALSEAFRVLRPGGRLVIGDMMFSLNPRSRRDRRIVSAKLRSIGRRGLPGLLRLFKNALRIATGRWEHPETAAWWRHALEQSGFEQISIELLRHEGGIASAQRPVTEPTAQPVAPPSLRAITTPRTGSSGAPPDHRVAASATTSYARTGIRDLATGRR
jgi:ubiquinone/menaquinone biosynthesis C-methylase UbiE